MFENFGKTIDRLIQSVGTETKATTIDPKSDPVSAPYPEGDNPQLRLEINVGTLDLKAGGDALVDGTVTYNVAEWAPRVATEGSRVTVKQDMGIHFIGAWRNMHNDWKLALGTSKPFGLAVAKGAGEARMALGGVPLTSAQVDVGAGKAYMSFDKPNSVRCSALKVNMGAGSLTVDGLLNGNVERFVFGGGAGEIRLNLTGEALQGPLTATLNTGAGKLVVNLKRGLPCQVTVKKFLGTVHTQGDFRAVSSEVYQTPSFALAGDAAVKVEINTPVAEIVLSELN